MNENRPSIVKSIGIITFLMIISKVLGLVREVAIASFYGVSSSTDAYFVAGGFVTNVFFGITAALSTVFLPFYLKSKKEKTYKQLSHEFSLLMSSLVVFSFIVIVILFFSAPIIIKVIAPSFEGDTLKESIIYLRIYSVSILFSLLTNMLTSLLNAEGRYGFGALASVIYSITSIAFMVILREYIGVAALVISIPFSLLIQLIILLINTRQYFKFKIAFNLFNPTLKYLVIIMLPVLLSNTTVELNQLLTRSIAAGLEKGSVSILSYSNTLFNFVSTLVTATFITVYYTEFSYVSKENSDKFNKIISQGIKLLIIILLPIMAITAIYSKDIVTIAYGRGKFDIESIRMTSLCLSLYSIAFVFDGVRNLLIKAFYSKNNARIPFVNSVISLILTTIGGFVLSKYFGVYGIVIAISVSICIATILLIANANKYLCVFDKVSIIDTLWKSFISIAITIVVLYLMNRLILDSSVYYRFVIATFTGFFIYLSSLVALKCKELKWIIFFIKRKFLIR